MWYYIKNETENTRATLIALAKQFDFSLHLVNDPTCRLYVDIDDRKVSGSSCLLSKIEGKPEEYQELTILEFIKKFSEISNTFKVILNSEHTATVTKNIVAISCQRFSHNEMRRIINEMTLALDSFKG